MLYDDFYTWNEIHEMLRISRSSVERWEKANKFPKRVKISENKIAWRKNEIEDWINNKKNEIGNTYDPAVEKNIKQSKLIPFEWENIDDNQYGETERAKVFGGWIIYRSVNQLIISMVFIPDPKHEWEIE